MMRARRRRMSLIIVIVALFLLINVGYAFLSQELDINGSTTINSASMNVYFSNPSSYGSADYVNCGYDYSNDEFNFNSELTLPGDTCYFTVDVVNDGSFPAELSFSSGGSSIYSFPYTYTDSSSGYTIEINSNDTSSPSGYNLSTDSYITLGITVTRTGENCDEDSCSGTSGAESFSLSFSASQAATN